MSQYGADVAPELYENSYFVELPIRFKAAIAGTKHEATKARSHETRSTKPGNTKPRNTKHETRNTKHETTRAPLPTVHALTPFFLFTIAVSDKSISRISLFSVSSLMACRVRSFSNSERSARNAAHLQLRFDHLALPCGVSRLFFVAETFQPPPIQIHHTRRRVGTACRAARVHVAGQRFLRGIDGANRRLRRMPPRDQFFCGDRIAPALQTVEQQRQPDHADQQRTSGSSPMQ